uniref:Copper transport protein n=1 Tax=Meloidogyne floridensis TaxID=298350 RepID=A0A915P5Z2_9BILA
MLTTVLNTNLNNSTTIITTTTNSSLIAWLKRWPKEFVRFLISPPSISDAMPDSGPWKYDYENSVLHFGEHEYVVFYFWKMGSGLGLAASMLVVSLVAILHEAVLGLRFILEREQTLLNSQKQQQKQSISTIRINERIPSTSTNNRYINEQNINEEFIEENVTIKSELKNIFRRTFTRNRMIQAFLYACQWGLFIFAFVLLFIGSPAMESVERIPPSPTTNGGSSEGLQLGRTRKSLRSF